VWQQIHQALPTRDARAAVLGVAIDAQGPDRVRAYVEQARATFRTLVDETGLLSHRLGFKAVPNGVLLDESGVVRYARFGGFNVQEASIRAMVERWLHEGWLDAAAVGDATETPDAEATALFEEGLEALRRGDRDSAARAWRRAAGRDPKNWLIRKQLWALEYPDRFYSGPVDFDWQREQIARDL
jgi:hypothetical protein